MIANYPGDAVAKQAFDVMMRRGWWAEQFMPEPFAVPKWRLDYGCFLGFFDGEHRDAFKRFHVGGYDDPFTCLIEADKWYRENVEAVTPAAAPPAP